MQMPEPDPDVLARRARIVARLRDALPAEAVIDDPAETRAYECDGLTAYRCPPLAAEPSCASTAPCGRAMTCAPSVLT